MSLRRPITGAFACAVAALGLGVGTAGAATVEVDSATDDGTNCTLREAVASTDGNADSGGCAASGTYGDDTITFAPGVTGTIPLDSTLTINPTAPGTLDIVGPGAGSLAVSGQDAHRVLRVTASANSAANAVEISRIGFREGFVGALDENSNAHGPGIHNEGRLTLDRVEVTDNAATITNPDPEAPFIPVLLAGGGIYNLATLVVTDSTVSQNSLSATAVGNGFVAVAQAAGGGIYSGGPSLTVRRSTIAGNSASAHAGGSATQVFAAAQGGGIGVADFLGVTAATVETSTVVSNTLAISDPPGTPSRGGGVSSRAAGNPTSVTVRGSTIAANGAHLGANVIADSSNMTLQSTALAEPQGGGGNCTSFGPVNTAGHNLSDDTSCGFGAAGDINNTPANLQPLADSGGPTQTRRPAPPGPGSPSPLIDAGVAAGQTTDQRGLTRTFEYDIANGDGGDGTDIGAVEVQGATPTTTNPATPNVDTTPDVTGTTEPGTTVQLYRDTGCTTAVGTPVTPAAFASPGIAVSPALAANSTTSFRATATYGTATSLCSPTGVTYQVPPGTPNLTSTNPASPANDNNPRILGTAPPASTVNLYTASDCTGTVAGTGSDTDLSGDGIAVTVPDNSTTTFYARATGAGGPSQCSPGITYRESTPPPSGPGTNPGTTPTTPAPPPAAPLKCKKGQQLKKGKCVKKKRKKKGRSV